MHELHDGEFSERSLRVSDVLEWPRQFLDRHVRLSVTIERRTHEPLSSTSNRSQIDVTS